MSYTLKKHANIAGYADTARDSDASANSTNLPDGWIDFEGKYWEVWDGWIVTEVADTGIFASDGSLSNTLYRPSGENFQDGKVIVHNHYTGTRGNWSTGAVILRFSPGSGGSGYGIRIVNAGLAYIELDALVNGVSTVVSPTPFGDASLTYPAWIEAIISTDGSGVTTVVCNVYADADAPDGSGDFGSAT